MIAPKNRNTLLTYIYYDVFRISYKKSNDFQQQANIEIYVNSFIKTIINNWEIAKIIFISFISLMIIIMIIIFSIKIANYCNSKSNHKKVNLVKGFLPQRINQLSQIRKRSLDSIKLDPITTELINTIHKENLKNIRKNLI